MSGITFWWRSKIKMSWFDEYHNKDKKERKPQYKDNHFIKEDGEWEINYSFWDIEGEEEICCMEDLLDRIDDDVFADAIKGLPDWAIDELVELRKEANKETKLKKKSERQKIALVLKKLNAKSTNKKR